MNKKIIAHFISLIIIFGGFFVGFLFNVTSAVEQVKINSLAPLSGKVGDIIAINGENFKTVDQILLGTKEIMYDTITENKITFKIPADSLGGKVTVKTENFGSATSLESLTISSVINQNQNNNSNSGIPSITYFAPTEGQVGDVITIKGIFLTNISSIYFGEIKALPETDNKFSILTVKVPKGATSGKIILVTADNKSIISDDDFKVTSGSGSNNQPVSTTNQKATGTPAANQPYVQGKGLVPKCNVTGTTSTDGEFATPCDFKYFMILINNLIKFLLFTIATPLIALILAYVGWLYMSHQGSSENLGKAKTILKNVVIGYIVALVAWLVVVAILRTLGYEGTIYLENY